jgi:hypothetical protein
MWPGALSLFIRGRWVPRKGWKVLTTKQSTKIYKGKGAMKTGLHDRWGRFQQLESMMPKYVVPSLVGFNLKPYVVKSAGTQIEEQEPASLTKESPQQKTQA